MILGDFFDYWVGDDASYTMAHVSEALRAYASTHTLYIMHGNRILLSHGDLWCTFDADYQKVRSVWWQWIMLRLPVKKRLQVAEDARARSRSRKSVKAAYITDVDERALNEAALAHEAEAVIHGHTHRPGIATTAAGIVRAVLPDWHFEGSKSVRGGWLTFEDDKPVIHGFEI